MLQGKRAPDAAGAQTANITEAHFVRLLGAGLLLMIALIALDGIIGVQAILSIRQNVSALTERQFGNVALIDEVQRAQAAYSNVVYGLSVDPRRESRARLSRHLDQTDAMLGRLLASIPSTDPDIATWRELATASDRVGSELETVLESAEARPDLSGVFKAREHLLAIISTLIRSNHERSETIGRQIEEITRKQIIEDVSLLTTVIAIALCCAWLVIRTARRLYRHLTAQSRQLRDVSWQLLEKQEILARRLSHELHDELGQSLTALKTNFSRHANTCSDPECMRDCTELLKESIKSTHEISQLLRPTILDDFGLDPALAWLCERFEERQNIDVQFESSIRERLDEAAETHVFRIAQEALTNVARHARASNVRVALTERDGLVHLAVSDNGAGISQANPDEARPRLGLVGMRARAESLRGEMTVTSKPGAGTKIQIEFPRREVAHAAEDPHSLGR